MKMTGNTILITGGSSGIGLELARQLQGGNTVIVTGRDQEKLNAVRSTSEKIQVMQSDASDPGAIAALYQRVVREFPALNMLINNAGIMRKISLRDGVADLAAITQEIEINLSGPVRMVRQFLPHLAKQRAAAIVNVSSGLAFVPFPIAPVYSATKAGLHAFTQALRVQMKGTPVKIFELAPPGTETPLFRGEFDEIDMGDMKGMEVGKLARMAIAGMEKDVLEIRPGLSNVLRMMSRVAPGAALGMLTKGNAKSLARMAEQAKA